MDALINIGRTIAVGLIRLALLFLIGFGAMVYTGFALSNLAYWWGWFFVLPPLLTMAYLVGRSA